MATKRGTRATKSTRKTAVKNLKTKALTSTQASRVKGGAGWDLRTNKKG